MFGLCLKLLTSKTDQKFLHSKMKFTLSSFSTSCYLSVQVVFVSKIWGYRLNKCLPCLECNRTKYTQLVVLKAWKKNTPPKLHLPTVSLQKSKCASNCDNRLVLVTVSQDLNLNACFLWMVEAVWLKENSSCSIFIYLFFQ